MATTVLTVGVTTYSSGTRASMGFQGLDSLKISVDEYCELEFSIAGCGPNPTFVSGQPVTLSVDGTVVFQGDIAGTPIGGAETGWVYRYHALDLKRRADYVTIQSRMGTAACQYNLDPDDNDYDPTYAGYTVGQIVQDVLQVYLMAQNLFAYGVGGYTFGVDIHGNPTAILNAGTVADLGFLTMVPRIPVRIEGVGVLSVLDQFIRDYYSQYCLWVQPFDGVIRVRNPFADFTTYTLKIPGTGQLSPDPVEWPEYTPETEHCATQYQIVGQDYSSAFLSTLPSEGTLTPVNDATDRSNWNLNYHLYPSGSVIYGSISITSSTSGTVTCDDPTAFWASGFFAGAEIWLLDPGVTGSASMTRRVATISAAMTAGGSADVEWSSSDPLDAMTTYTRFMLVGTANPLSNVDKLFWVTDPSTGDTGLDTAIGANLRDRDPNGFSWGNLDGVTPTFYAAAKVLWGINSDNSNPALRWPMQEIPVGCKVIRSTGQILLDTPACLVAALAAGTADALFNGYPSTALGGLWYAVVAAVPFSRGPLVAKYPSSGFAGTAFSDYGISRIHQEFPDYYTSRSQNADMIALATAKASCVQDAVIEGTILHHGLPTGFDAFAQGISLNMVMPATSPLDSRPMPVRTAVIRWPNDGADTYNVSFRFSNRKAPFSGDSRYIHPSYTSDTSGVATFDTSGPGFDMGDMTSGMAGRGGRQAQQREDKGALPNTTGGVPLPAKIDPFDENAMVTPKPADNSLVGPPKPAKGSGLPNTAGGKVENDNRRPLPNTSGGKRQPTPQQKAKSNLSTPGNTADVHKFGPGDIKLPPVGTLGPEDTTVYANKEGDDVDGGGIGGGSP